MLSGAILQALPRNNGIHFFQENLTTRLTLFVLVFCFGNSQLAHDSARWAKKWTMRLLSQNVGSYSEAPLCAAQLAIEAPALVVGHHLHQGPRHQSTP